MITIISSARGHAETTLIEELDECHSHLQNGIQVPPAVVCSSNDRIPVNVYNFSKEDQYLHLRTLLAKVSYPQVFQSFQKHRVVTVLVEEVLVQTGPIENLHANPKTEIYFQD